MGLRSSLHHDDDDGDGDAARAAHVSPTVQLIEFLLTVGGGWVFGPVDDLSTGYRSYGAVADLVGRKRLKGCRLERRCSGCSSLPSLLRRGFESKARQGLATAKGVAVLGD